MKTAIVILAPGSRETAQRIAAMVENSEIHGLARRVEADVFFDDTVPHLQSLFAANLPIVGVCAAGILIRALGPLLADKRAEPPVVAVAEDGSAAVPLLGGHHGANDLARRIADALGGPGKCLAAVTTAGDTRFGVALDDPPEGWTLSNPNDAKPFMAALLAGGAVAGDVPEFLADSGLPRDPAGTLRISETVRAETGDATRLVYRPKRLAVGVGCERGTDPAELIALVRQTLADMDLAEQAVAGVFSLDLKADEPAVHASAHTLGVDARFFDTATLEAETPRLATPSEAVFREVGCHGVAEGAALAAAGPDATLCVPKKKSLRATCAVAEAPGVINAAAAGAPQGRLLVVGTGPGGDGWMTAESEAAVATATDLVGYSLYLDLLGERAAGKMRLDFPLGEETDRVRAALDLAAAGKTVALVSSGDPGIYAMATLVFEQVETPVTGPTGAASRSRCAPASRRCRRRQRASARRSATISAPYRSPIC